MHELPISILLWRHIVSSSRNDDTMKHNAMNRMEQKLSYINNRCEYDPTTRRKMLEPQTPEHIRYVQLWTNGVLRKLLKARAQQNREHWHLQRRKHQMNKNVHSPYISDMDGQNIETPQQTPQDKQENPTSSTYTVSLLSPEASFKSMVFFSSV